MSGRHRKHASGGGQDTIPAGFRMVSQVFLYGSAALLLSGFVFRRPSASALLTAASLAAGIAGITARQLAAGAAAFALAVLFAWDWHRRQRKEPPRAGGSGAPAPGGDR